MLSSETPARALGTRDSSAPHPHPEPSERRFPWWVKGLLPSGPSRGQRSVSLRGPRLTQWPVAYARRLKPSPCSPAFPRNKRLRRKHERDLARFAEVQLSLSQGEGKNSLSGQISSRKARCTISLFPASYLGSPSVSESPPPPRPPECWGLGVQTGELSRSAHRKRAEDRAREGTAGHGVGRTGPCSAGPRPSPQRLSPRPGAQIPGAQNKRNYHGPLSHRTSSHPRGATGYLILENLQDRDLPAVPDGGFLSIGTLTSSFSWG